MAKAQFRRADSMAPHRRETIARWDAEHPHPVETPDPTRFEMQYIGEAGWYPIPADDVAHTLGAYFPEVDVCFVRLAGGEVLSSPLSRFRIVIDDELTMRSQTA